jgi:hypothetical protein
VQARTQQLTASEGQSGLLLNRAHGRNLAAGRGPKQESTKMAHSTRLILILLISCPAFAQTVDFKVVWSTLGSVKSAGKDAVPIQSGSRVVRVDVHPAIVEMAAGKQICISALQLSAFGPDGRALADAPVEIAVRQDQKPQLQLTRPKGDLCMRPSQPGEYPIRFTSKLPAPDDTVRGAQVFLRAR